jgi:hypothetical protein
MIHYEMNFFKFLKPFSLTFYLGVMNANIDNITIVNITCNSIIDHSSLSVN